MLRNIKKPALSFAIVSALALPVVVVGVSAPGLAATPKPATPVTTISGYTFAKLTLKAGAKFKVVNKDGADHTYHVAGTKVDPLVRARSTLLLTAPTKPGTYKVSCDFHPTMHGLLVVTK